MKKIIALGVLLIFTAGGVIAQEHELFALASPAASESESAPKLVPPKAGGFTAKPAKRLKFGFRAGAGSNFFSGNPSGYSVKYRIGFNAGVYVRIYIFQRLYVQPGLNYYFDSYKFKRSLDNKEDNVIIHRLQIPVLAGITVFEKKAFGMVVQTGPAIGIHLKANDNDIGVRNDDFDKVDASWITNMHLHITKVVVTAGFDVGMTKYYGGQRSHSWYLGLGFGL